MSTQTPPADADRSSGIPVFGALTDAQTYKNILYLLLRFPLGIIYFTIFVTTLSTGLVLTPFVVGIAILAFVPLCALYLGRVEAALTEQLLGRTVDYDYPDPNEQPLVPLLKATVTDFRSYVVLAYLFLTFPVGLGVFTVFVTLGALSVAFIVAPLVYQLSSVEYTLGPVDMLGDAGPVVIDTLPEALVVSVIGLVLALVTLHLTSLLGRIHGAIAQRVLSQ